MRVEDRNHFEAFVPRIYELGGKLPEDVKEFQGLAGFPPARLPKSTKDVKALLKVLLKAEQCAVRQCTSICNMTAGKDHRTYDLAGDPTRGDRVRGMVLRTPRRSPFRAFQEVARRRVALCLQVHAPVMRIPGRDACDGRPGVPKRTDEPQSDFYRRSLTFPQGGGICQARR